MKTFVNILSIFRIMAAFVIVPLLLQRAYGAGFVIFAAGCLTDFLDGYLARRFNVVSKLGGVLDHTGDKFIVASALVMAVWLLPSLWVIAPSVLMICRELYVSGLREFLGTQKIEFGVPKRRFAVGKIKTAVQMLALSVLLLWAWVSSDCWECREYADILRLVGVAGLWLALSCSLLSAAQYTADFAGNLKKIK